MEISDFISKYKEAFGDVAPLPIAFGYGDSPVTDVKKLPKCMVGAISKVRDGESLTLCADNVTCGGGGLYTAFTAMPERVPVFVSEVEHYKQSKEMVLEAVTRMDIRISPKPYLNFVRIDKLGGWDGIEGMLFFATPDILSGLCSWAFYDNNDDEAVCTRFASGCASIVSFAVKENREHGRRCFIGLLDPSARLLIPKHELTFTIPMSRFSEMLTTMEDSSLFQKSCSMIRRRINGEIQRDV